MESNQLRKNVRMVTLIMEMVEVMTEKLKAITIDSKIPIVTLTSDINEKPVISLKDYIRVKTEAIEYLNEEMEL